MSRKVKILVIVATLAAMLAIIGGTVYAASGAGSGAGWCSLWDRACGQGDRSGCGGCNGDQLGDGSCH
jgi:hypothetical protein